MERTIENLRQIYPSASDEDLQRYIDFRDEGHSAYASKLMAGLSDPDEPCATCDGAGEWDEGPLPAHSAATEPEYRHVKCPDCKGNAH